MGIFLARSAWDSLGNFQGGHVCFLLGAAASWDYRVKPSAEAKLRQQLLGCVLLIQKAGSLWLVTSGS